MSTYNTNDCDGVRKHALAAAAKEVPAGRRMLPSAIPFETARRHLHFGSARVRLVEAVFGSAFPWSII
jgi:hypothetical protein